MTIIYVTKGIEHDKRNPPLQAANYVINKLFGDQTT